MTPIDVLKIIDINLYIPDTRLSNEKLKIYTQNIRYTV